MKHNIASTLRVLTATCLLLAGAAFASDKPASFDPGQFASPDQHF